MVTHFSLGSFLSSQGLSTSPFLTRLEWKYLCWGIWSAVDEPAAETGMDPYGVVKGFALGAGVMASLSGVPGRRGVGFAVVFAVVLAVPLWR